MIIDCNKIRQDILDEAKQQVAEINSIGKQLKLVVVQVDGDQASNVYIRNKIKTCEEVGIKCEHIKLPSDTNYYILRETIIACGSENSEYTACMLQLPLPEHLRKYEQKLLDLIHWTKDCDGLTTTSAGRLWNGLPCVKPATAQGIMRLLDEDLSGKNVVVAGRSKLVGLPLIKLLQDRNATVTTIHSKSLLNAMQLEKCNIFISAIGKPKYWKHQNFMSIDEDLYDYTICHKFIDVGINRDENGKLCGDIDIDSFTKVYVNNYREYQFTPVPKGVGLITTSQLMLNVVECYKLQTK